MNKHKFMEICSLSDLGLISRELYQDFFSGCRSDSQRFDLKKRAKQILVPSYRLVSIDDSFESLPLIGSLVSVHYKCQRGIVVFGQTSIRLYGTTAIIDPDDLIEFEWRE